MAGEACVGVYLAELHFPEARSLKDKRAPLKSLRDVRQKTTIVWPFEGQIRRPS